MGALLESRSRKLNGDWEFAPQRGTNFGMRRRILLSPKGLPCTPPPWGTLHAVNMETGRTAWDVPFGRLSQKVPEKLGSVSLGGPIVTASGLVFAAGTLDPNIRAFDAVSGQQLWKGTVAHQRTRDSHDVPWPGWQAISGHLRGRPSAYRRSAAGRLRGGLFVVNRLLLGIHPVREALRAHKPLDKVLVAKGTSGPRVQEIIELCKANSIPVRFEPRESLDRSAKGISHQNVIAFGATRGYVELADVMESCAVTGSAGWR